MRLLLIVVAVVFPALALASAGAPAGVAVVSVNTRGFDPPALTVNAGDTVTWTNTGPLQHRIVSDTEAFKPSPVLQPGQSWSFTFRAKGRFAYRDELHASLTGSLTVTPPPPSVTIGSPQVRMTYLGSGLVLTGRVSSHKAGEQVLVLARTCGQVATEQNDVVTRAGGIWKLSVRPGRTTQYGARWGQIPSPAFRVSVLPRMRLFHVQGGYGVRIRAATAFTGRTVLLQRRDEVEDSWDLVTTAKLRNAGLTVPPTLLSTATLKARSGGRVRAVLSAAQAAPCYGQATSNVLSR